MTLHRDIFWLGQQWAVTGFGIQAINKKLDGQFDIETSRLWDEDLASSMQQFDWFDADDFTEALAVARRRSREQPVTFRPASGGER
jgi:hypothetical protein